MIFISYRKSDAYLTAGLLADRLAAVFGREKIFKDDQSIEDGERWPERLRRELGRSQVLVAVIGPNWLHAHDPDGRRRLDDPDDWVRMEICTALREDKKVLVVLADGAPVPRQSGMPRDCELKNLCEIQPTPLGPGPSWEKGFDKVVSAIRKVIDTAVPGPGEPGPGDGTGYLPGLDPLLIDHRIPWPEVIEAYRHVDPGGVRVLNPCLAPDVLLRQAARSVARLPGPVPLLRFVHLVSFGRESLSAHQLQNWVSHTLARLAPPRAGHRVRVRSSTLELPFVIGVLADLSGSGGPGRGRPASWRFVPVSREALPDLFRNLRPRVRFTSPGNGPTGDPVELEFSSPEDFSPAEVAARLAASGSDASGRATGWSPLNVSRNPSLEALAGSWAGLAHLLHVIGTDDQMEVRVLDITREELYRDLTRYDKATRSRLYDLVYDQEFGAFGGVPFGMLVGDFAFDVSSPESVLLLKRLAEIAAAAHALFVSSAGPESFDLTSFADLSRVRAVSQVFRGDEFAAWREFRYSTDSRSVALACPRVRHAHHAGRGGDAAGPWWNPAWAYAACAARAFSRSGWFDRLHSTQEEAAVVAPGEPPPGPLEAEAAWSEDRAAGLVAAGFMPLAMSPAGDRMVFAGHRSCHRVGGGENGPGQAVTAVAAAVPNLLCVSRFAHALQRMKSDKPWAFVTADQCQAALTEWVRSFVAGAPAEGEPGVRRPLSNAQVTVEEVTRGDHVEYRVAAELHPDLPFEPIPSAFVLNLTFRGPDQGVTPVVVSIRMPGRH